jgi:hypothetical protein
VLLVGGTSAGEAAGLTELYVPWWNSYLQLPAAEAAGDGTITALKKNGTVMMTSSSSTSVNTASVATVTTDKPDYSPGDTVTVSGTGWQPGETIQIVITEDPPNHPTHNYTVTADANGTFSQTIFLVDQLHLGVTFYLTATGITSGRTAQTTFTDGDLQTQKLCVDMNGPSGGCSAGSGQGVGETTGLGQNDGVLVTRAAGSVFPVQIEVSHKSGQSSHNASGTVTISLPSGYSLVAGENAAKTTSSLPNSDSSQTISWSVNAPAGATNPAVISVALTSVHPVTGNTTPRRIRVQTAIIDLTPPVITPSISGTLGNDGWYTSNVTLTWTVADAQSTITSTSGCGSTTVSADTAGTTFTCTATSAGGTSSQSVTIKRDATAPTATFGSQSPAANGNGWNNTNVSFPFTPADNLAGVSSTSPAVSPLVLTTEGTAVTGTVTVTDNAGNSASFTSPSVKIDKTGPTITFVSRTAANTNGWNKDDVTVNWSCTDGLSGVTAASVSQSVTTEGANQSSTGICSDLAGNTSQNTQTGINIDKTKPTVNPQALPSANANGWNNTNVTVTFMGSDLLSGIDNCTTAVTLTSEGAGQSAGPGTCTDKAGNISDPATATGINIDKTKPSVTFGPQSPGANSYGWNNTDVSVPFTPADALSGVATFSPTSPLLLTTEGAAVSATVTVTDKAANSETVASPAVKIDKTKPTTNANASPSANANGWNNTNVTVTFTGNDSLSGIQSCTTAVILSAEGAAQSSSPGTCKDKAGNVSDPAGVTGINIDKTAPSLVGSRAPLANSYGWNNTDVNVTFNCADSLSGIYQGPSSPQVFTAEGLGQTASAHCTDKAGNSSTAAVTGINIDKTKPEVSNVLMNPNPVAVNTPTTITALAATGGVSLAPIASAAFKLDAGAPVSMSAVGGFGGGTSENLTKTTSISVPDVASLCVIAIDEAGNESDITAGSCIFAVFYDPNGGFVTGGGWFNSPGGAFVADPLLTGKANFGFNSKYQKGATVPTGNTEFQFHAGNLNFKSTSYEWLVVAGARAQFKGTGTVNGTPGYGFMLTAIDGQINGGGGMDKFRIKITGPGGLLYDNLPNAPDTADPTTAISGGSIVIHAK